MNYKRLLNVTGLKIITHHGIKKISNLGLLILRMFFLLFVLLLSSVASFWSFENLPKKVINRVIEDME